MTDLINQLRTTASKGISVWGDLQMEAANQIEALTAERDGLLALHTEQINYTVKIAAERDALKDAARLALGSLELIRSQVKAWDHGDAAIAALKAVL